MKKLLLALVFLITYSQLCQAQKGIEKLTHYKIDSLQHIHVDTILYYCSYCGECEILGKKRNCYLASGYTVSSNFIIYQQQGNFYLLDFDCYNQSIKRQLNSCQSIPYFISIIPTLKISDRSIKAALKKGKLLDMIQSDGGFENVEMFLNKNMQIVSISESEKDNTDKIHQKYYRINEKKKLVKLISADLSMKTN
jgi:hypothetical protein